jgi:hypothetical protein
MLLLYLGFLGRDLLDLEVVKGPSAEARMAPAAMNLAIVESVT